jgi:hypothetical protein
MKALKRLTASAMLSLALVAGAAQTAAAEIWYCWYDHTDVIITPDTIYIIDHYYCVS